MKGLGFTIILIVAATLSGCATQRQVIEQVVESAQQEIDEKTEQLFETTSTIIFAGKVVDSDTGAWPNDYLVLVFLNGEEVSRGFTALGEFKESGEGTHDGLFVLKVENTYKLLPNAGFVLGNEQEGSFSEGKGLLGNISYIYVWFNEVNVGSLLTMEIVGKNAQYAIKVMPNPRGELLPEILDGHTKLTEDGEVVIVPSPPPPNPTATMAK